VEAIRRQRAAVGKGQPGIYFLAGAFLIQTGCIIWRDAAGFDGQRRRATRWPRRRTERAAAASDCEPHAVNFALRCEIDIRRAPSGFR